MPQNAGICIHVVFKTLSLSVFKGEPTVVVRQTGSFIFKYMIYIFIDGLGNGVWLP